MIKLSTSRLRLIELGLEHLEACLSSHTELEAQLNMNIAPDFLTERVHRAVRMKVRKMREAEPSHHAWLTYWLIIIKEDNIGAGMLGFKGYPSAKGSTEIGYGIAPAHQNKGYMSEAVRSLIEWAFSHPFCKTITATEVYNPASRRLLEKLGATLVSNTAESTSWKIQKKMK